MIWKPEGGQRRIKLRRRYLRGYKKRRVMIRWVKERERVKPLSDQFPVRVCSCPLCIINRL